ncbi:MAG: putative DNA modification/repair radical SAM protein, partial [Clostridia bacterium]|nr:putative DNA modification/repair radical SAM protein [Clostridia bacterium]
YDCKYCVNRVSNHRVRRASFTPRELADLTMAFYRRNYIEGLFLSSGVIGSPDRTSELLLETVRLLREEYGFGGYIHVKAIPGTDPRLLDAIGYLADRMSVNVELPSSQSLQKLAPDKSKRDILLPMRHIADRRGENREELVRWRRAPKFVPAGQSTQMVVGATPESDYQILHLAESLYRAYDLKRVFFSAYIPVGEDRDLPSPDTKPPLLREHRLYQADWLLRFYHFRAEEILDEEHPNFNPVLDPKCNWAVHHMEAFPVEVMKARTEELLRVPGIGPKSARRIVSARRAGMLDFKALIRLGVVMKRAQYFITCGGKLAEGLRITDDAILGALVPRDTAKLLSPAAEQLSLIPEELSTEDVRLCLKS